MARDWVVFIGQGCALQRTLTCVCAC